MGEWEVVWPAYGRDYPNALRATEAFKSGVDFTSNKGYCSIRNFKPGTKVEVRYNKKQRLVVVTV